MSTSPICARAGEDGPCWGELVQVELIPGARFQFADFGDVQVSGPTLCRGHREAPYLPDPITLAAARAWWDASRYGRDDVDRLREQRSRSAWYEFLPPWDAPHAPLEQASAKAVTEALVAADRVRREGLGDAPEPADFAAWAVARELLAMRAVDRRGIWSLPPAPSTSIDGIRAAIDDIQQRTSVRASGNMVMLGDAQYDNGVYVLTDPGSASRPFVMPRTYQGISPRFEPDDFVPTPLPEQSSRFEPPPHVTRRPKGKRAERERGRRR